MKPFLTIVSLFLCTQSVWAGNLELATSWTAPNYDTVMGLAVMPDGATVVGSSLQGQVFWLNQGKLLASYRSGTVGLGTNGAPVALNEREVVVSTTLGQAWWLEQGKMLAQYVYDSGPRAAQLSQAVALTDGTVVLKATPFNTDGSDLVWLRREGSVVRELKRLRISGYSSNLVALGETVFLAKPKTGELLWLRDGEVAHQEVAGKLGNSSILVVRLNEQEAAFASPAQGVFFVRADGKIQLLTNASLGARSGFVPSGAAASADGKELVLASSLAEFTRISYVRIGRNGIQDRRVMDGVYNHAAVLPLADGRVFFASDLGVGMIGRDGSTTFTQALTKGSVHGTEPVALANGQFVVSGTWGVFWVKTLNH